MARMLEKNMANRFPILSAVQSPCVRNCCLDDRDVCMGCFRHLEEIKQWSVYTDAEKRAVLALAKQRRKGVLVPSPSGRGLG